MWLVLGRRNEIARWPDGGWLVHAAFGIRRYELQPLPLVERDLPPDFTALDEDEQERRMQTVLSEVVAWGVRIGCDLIDAELPLRQDWALVDQVGLPQVRSGRFSGPFAAVQGLALTRTACPERVWITRGEELVIYVHETWDSVVVQASEGEIASLREALARGG